MSGTNASSASFQQAMEQVRQQMPSVTMLAIEHALRDCDGNVEACVTALKRYAGDDTRVKYLRHQSYPQGISQLEQEEAEKGIPYSNSWSASDLKRGYNTIGPNYRYHKSAKPAAEMNLMSLQHQHSDAGIDSSSTGGELHSSQPPNVDSVDSMAGAVAAMSLSKLPSVDEASEEYLTTRQERLDSLKKTPSLDDTIGAQRRQLEALEKRIEMLNQQTDAFKEETVGKQQRLQYLRTKYPAVNKFKIEEQGSLVLTLEDDVAQLNDNLMYLKKEGW